MREPITSRENPAVQHYIRLRDKAGLRRELGVFVTEGHKLTSEALSAGCSLLALYVTASSMKTYHAYDATLVSDSVGDKLAAGKSHQGVFAVFKIPQPQPLVPNPKGRYLMLWDLQDTGNVGTILRTAGAFGLDGVFLSSGCADLWSLKTLRAGMGGVFRVPFEVVEDMCACIQKLQSAQIKVLAAALEDNAAVLTPQMLSGEQGVAVVIGNEGHGLPAWVIDSCNGCVMLPMHNGTESLNAAAAAAVFAWELHKG